MSSATGLGLLDLLILEAIEAAGASSHGPYMKTQRALDVLHERTGIGSTQAYESLCDMARPYVVHLPLIDFNGNYGSPDWEPASARYTECRLTPLGEAALAAERGERGTLPIALMNGDLHQGGHRPPLDPRRLVDAVRASVSGCSDDSIVDIVGLPAFPSRCDVAGDLAEFATGAACEVVASASMADGHVRGQPTVTITALPPFTSAGRIAGLIENAVGHQGRGIPTGRPPTIDDELPCPVTEVSDQSSGGRTQLVVTGRSEASHSEVRQFLQQIPTVQQRVRVALEHPLAELVRALTTSDDLHGTLDLIERSIHS